MIKAQLAVFLIVGLLTVLLDFLTYLAIVKLQYLDISLAKVTGFLTGTVFAYLANRFWTFRHNMPSHASLWRFIMLYAVTLAANVFVNNVFIELFGSLTNVFLLAFILATGFSAALNFLGMKFFVFKRREVLDPV